MGQNWLTQSNLTVPQQCTKLDGTGLDQSK